MPLRPEFSLLGLWCVGFEVALQRALVEPVLPPGGCVYFPAYHSEPCEAVLRI